MIDLKKFQTDFDVYSDQLSAQSKSNAMGLGGAIHVYDIDGQAYYMPGATHKEYLMAMEPEGSNYQEDDYNEVTDDIMVQALRAVVAEIMNKKQTDTNTAGKILKVDEEQRIIYGWASVITEKGVPVVDLQGDVIGADTLVKAVNKFMEHVRVGKTMHDGEETGKVIHSLPVTKEICDALGIQTDREGWIVAYKVYDDNVWSRVKSGELRAFSIGGRAQREEL
jgi:hypothetical protein